LRKERKGKGEKGGETKERRGKGEEEEKGGGGRDMAI